MVHHNLIKALPDKDDAEIIKIEKSYFRHLSDYFIETIKGLTLSKNGFAKRYRLINPEIFHQYYKEKKSIIIYCTHYANWEWFSSLPIYIPHQMCALYQPQAAKVVDHITKKGRERFGVIAIESKKAFRELSHFANKNVLTATLVLGDLRPFPKSTRYWIKFLGLDTTFTIGADRIAKKLNQVVIFPHVRKIKRGYYEVEFKLITDTIEDIESNKVVDMYAEQLENVIREKPDFWLWSHNRWKHKKPA